MIRSLCIFFLYLIFFTQIASAVTDDTVVRQQIGVDTQPPSTPTLLSATPVASTQIDLAWSTSTDNVQLEGYRVFRDSVQIATTTLTTYSDTGLAALTAYSYFVQAFDNSLLFSSSSNALSTTTLQAISTSTPLQTGGGNGARENVELVSLEIVPGIHTTQISWETNRYVQFELRWGRSLSYELGFVTNGLFLRSHTAHIVDLEPGTTYEYQLVAYDRTGRMNVLSEDRFQTLSAPDQNPPANVSSLQAEFRNDDVVLSWINPSDDDFSHVRIVRSHLFYPSDPYDGFIAYQGSGVGFTDRRSAHADELYYTVFSYDRAGNVSSGSVVKVTRGAESIFESTEELSLRFADLEVLQEGERIPADSIDALTPFTVRIAYEKLPEHLKTIIVTLSHPEDKKRSFSFLLRINKDKTYYEATIAPLFETGIYPVILTVFDHQTQMLGEISGTFTLVGATYEETLLGLPLTLETKKTITQTAVAWLLILLFLLVWLYILLRSLFIAKGTPAGRLGLRISTFVALFAFSGLGAYFAVSSLGFTPQGAFVAHSIQGNWSFEGTLYLIVLCVLLALCAIACSAVVTFLKQKGR